MRRPLTSIGRSLGDLRLFGHVASTLQGSCDKTRSTDDKASRNMIGVCEYVRRWRWRESQVINALFG